MEIREVKIEEYWPLIVKGTAEFGQIAAALNPEFNKLAECIYRVLNESFIQDASEYGVSRWESILGITPAAGATLDDRKAAILTYMNIKLPYTWRVLKQMLVPILGDEDKFVMEYVNDEGKLVLHTDRLDDAMLATVDDMLSRVLPQNIEVVHQNYILPAGYKRVAWLQSFSEAGNSQWVTVIYDLNRITCISADAEETQTATASSVYRSTPFSHLKNINNWRFDIKGYLNKINVNPARAESTLFTKENRAILNGVEYAVTAGTNAGNYDRLNFLGQGYEDTRYHGGIRLFSASVQGEDGLVFDLIPALDETGAPCLFDTVNKQPYYNKGTGDFAYPTDEAPAAAIGLDDKFYAQLTEHGVRRLYRVPEGCTMTKDEYAAANGFKEIVEPPMPLEGYWTPQWRETETQVILEWIETEPPMEVTENE